MIDKVDIKKLTKVLPIFPLPGAIVLPNGNLPLNIFEPRYVDMINDSMKSNKFIGMIQPRNSNNNQSEPILHNIGCLGKITNFKTFMTGELFGVISNHTLIRHSTSIKGWNQESFEEGIHDGFNNPGLIASNLFSLRAESIVNNMDRDQARSTLSGLLLGVELNGAQSYWKDNNVTLIGSELLSNNYHQGLKVLGGQSQLFSLEAATLSGLSSAYKDLVSG